MARRRTEPRWLSRLVVDAIHADQIRQHGGLAGLREETVLESALARPQQKWAYDEEPDIAVLAAAYAFGLVRNHPYRDGNKRIGFLALVTFLGINDHRFRRHRRRRSSRTMLALADGSLSESALALWIRRSSRRRQIAARRASLRVGTTKAKGR